MKDLLGDGSGGGPYAVADDKTTELWHAAVADVRDVLINGWTTPDS